MQRTAVKNMTMQEVEDDIEFGNRFIKKIEDDLMKIEEIHGDYSEEERENENDNKGIIKLNHEKQIELYEQKEELIKKIIGQMYRGVLIDDEISIRKDGEIFPYKRQSNNWLKTPQIKKKIISHIHEVSEKISANNMDILEFVLDLVEEKEDDGTLATIEIPDYYFCDIDTDRNDKIEKIHFELINAIKIDWNGEINFNYNEGGNRYNNSVSSRQEKLLIKKYSTLIEDTLKDYIAEQKKKIEKLENEIEKIKEKGRDLLTIATLKRERDSGMGI